jgi:hypothetical protein
MTDVPAGLSSYLQHVVSGTCLCGAIEFELQPSRPTAANRTMGVCHCTACRRWSGAESLPFVVTVPERFRVHRGLDQMAHYRDVDSTMRAFCRRCGSSLYQDMGTTFHVSAGALRDLAVEPTFDLHGADESPLAR